MSAERIVYLNGKFLPVDKAHVSVMDRGFLFADGVYEVVPFFNNRLFLPQEHLTRLRNSLSAIDLTIELDDQAFLSIFQELLQRNADLGPDRVFYLQITRGAFASRDHCFPAQNNPTIFIQCTAVKPNSLEELSAGAEAIILPDIRWQWCYIKAISLLPNVLYAQQAKMSGAKEAILIRDGLALEGTSSNLFIVKNATIITPPLSPQILPGVTRDLLLRLAKENHFSCLEQDIPEADLLSADEVLMTGSVKEILPITKINNTAVGNGKLGPFSLRLIQLYQDFKHAG